MRKPKDRKPRFKKGDKVRVEGELAVVVSEGWWDQVSDFRYEIDFNFRTTKGPKTYWVTSESTLTSKEDK
jgi:hypothetical protein